MAHVRVKELVHAHSDPASVDALLALDDTLAASLHTYTRLGAAGNAPHQQVSTPVSQTRQDAHESALGIPCVPTLPMAPAHVESNGAQRPAALRPPPPLSTPPVPPAPIPCHSEDMRPHKEAPPAPPPPANECVTALEAISPVADGLPTGKGMPAAEHREDQGKGVAPVVVHSDVGVFAPPSAPTFVAETVESVQPSYPGPHEGKAVPTSGTMIDRAVQAFDTINANLELAEREVRVSDAQEAVNACLAAAQEFLNPQQVKRADGCNLNRRTLQTIKAANFASLDAQYFELKDFYVLNPTVAGIARM